MRRTQFSFTSPDNFYYNDSKLMTAVNMAYDLTNREDFTRYDTLHWGSSHLEQIFVHYKWAERVSRAEKLCVIELDSWVRHHIILNAR